MNNDNQINTEAKCQLELNSKYSNYSKQGNSNGKNTSKSILKITQQQSKNTDKKRK